MMYKGYEQYVENEYDVFQELIQNADDAGATEVKFLLDTTHYPTQRLFSDEMDQYQVHIQLALNPGMTWNLPCTSLCCLCVKCWARL